MSYPQPRVISHWFDLPAGLFWITQRSDEKGIEHHAVLDVGDRLELSANHRLSPVIIHQTPPQIRVDWFQNTGSWNLLLQLEDEA
jgi:hypothetical protein